MNHLWKDFSLIYHAARRSHFLVSLYYTTYLNYLTVWQILNELLSYGRFSILSILTFAKLPSSPEFESWVKTFVSVYVL